MIFTFYKARGLDVGKSLVEEDKLELASNLEAKAKTKGVELLLPSDVVLANEFSPTAESRVSNIDSIHGDWMGLDIGPQSIKVFQNTLAECKTIIWNGPLGVFENKNFNEGTNQMANFISNATKNGAFSLVGGGDSVSAIKKNNKENYISFISTGGGALLHLIGNGYLPALKILRAID